MRKKIIVSVVLAVAAVVLVGGVYAAWMMTPPGLPDDAEAGLAVLTSARYERLPDYRKQQYVAATREHLRQLPDDERKALMERFWDDASTRDVVWQIKRDAMMDRARRYANAGPEERDAILDEVLDMHERRRGERKAGGDRAAAEKRGDGRLRDFRQHFQERIEQGNPQDMGLMREFFGALKKRRQERQNG